MRFGEIEKYSPAEFIYNLKDKAYNHVMLRVMKALEEAERIRKGVRTSEDFKTWQEEIKKNFKASVGKLPYDRNFPLNAQTTGSIEEAELTIENIIFEAREKVYVTANLYIPREKEAKCPAVLLQCGHSLNGKAAEAYQRAARIIAKAGIMVLVMDPPGQGERCIYIENGEYFIRGASSEHQQFGHQCFLTGDGPVKYFVADAMRAVDYLCSRPEVDADRIGATGISGGGTMASVLAALDDRIKAAAPGCWPTAGWEYFLQGCSPDAEQIWLNVTKEHIDHYEIMACMCPKPLLLLAMEEDFVPIEGTEKLYAECQRLWALNDSSGKVHMRMEAGDHGFSEGNARAAAHFFKKYLFGGDTRTESKNEAVSGLLEEKLYCTKSGQVRLDYPESVTIFEENIEEYKRYCQNMPGLEERRQALWERVYYDRKPVPRFHVRHLEKWCKNGIHAESLLWFTQELMPCYGVMFRGMELLKENTPVTICLWQRGTDQLATHQEEIRQILRSGRSAFVVDLTAMGKCMPNLPLSWHDPYGSTDGVKDKLSKALFMLGDSLCAMEVFDLMQTIKMLYEQFEAEDIELYAEGKYAILARIAEVLDGDICVRTYNEVTVSQLITEKYYDTYDIGQVLMPGMGRYNGGDAV